jgi:uncharacterized coiled-coil protein SlyX
MRYQNDSSDNFTPRLKLKEGVSRSPLQQRISPLEQRISPLEQRMVMLEQKLSELASVSRHRSDSAETAPLRMKRQEGVSRSPLEQRMVMLERKVSELSKVINGLAIQLADVSSSVRDIKRPTQVQEDVELLVKKRGAQRGEKAEKKSKTEYIIAENDYPIQEKQQSRGNVVIADKDYSS